MDILQVHENGSNYVEYAKNVINNPSLLVHAKKGHFGVEEAMHALASGYKYSEIAEYLSPIQYDGITLNRYSTVIKINELDIHLPTVLYFTSIISNISHEDPEFEDTVAEVYSVIGIEGLLPILAIAGFEFPEEGNLTNRVILSVRNGNKYFGGLRNPRNSWKKMQTHPGGIKGALLDTGSTNKLLSFYNALCRSRGAEPRLDQGFWDDPVVSLSISNPLLYIVRPSNAENEIKAGKLTVDIGHDYTKPPFGNRDDNGLVTAWVNFDKLPNLPSRWNISPEATRFVDEITIATL